MRLYELIDFAARPSKQSFTGYKSRIKRNTTSSLGGRGSFGSAYDIESPKRQNEITKLGQAGRLDMFSKIEHTSAAEDGYIVWLKAAHTLAEKGNRNPYFPVINNLIIRQSPTKKEYYRVDLEKLVSYTSEKIITNYDLMRSIYEYMFHKTPDDTTEPEYMYDMIQFRLKNAIYHNDISGIKDKNLSDIVGITHHLLTKHKFTLDLHKGNLMWRVTNNRPHMVILDPFA